MGRLVDLVESIPLRPGAPILEVGCGAGHGSVALARRGYDVTAIDTVPAMVARARELAAEAAIGRMLKSFRGDVYALEFPDESFALVVAMGVLPWLPSIREPMQEICRVLRPGGHVVVSVDNRWCLRHFLEPLTNPLLAPAGSIIKRALRGASRRGPGSLSQLVSIREADSLFDAVGLDKVDGSTLGFGPITLFRSEILPSAVGLKVHRVLQRLADRRVPFVCAAGSQYLFLGRKRSDG